MNPGESMSPSCMAADVERVTGLSLTVRPTEFSDGVIQGKSLAKLKIQALHGKTLLLRITGF